MKRLMQLVLFASFAVTPALAQSGDPQRGQQDFRACAPCHSLRNVTEPV